MFHWNVGDEEENVEFHWKKGLLENSVIGFGCEELE